MGVKMEKGDLFINGEKIGAVSECKMEPTMSADDLEQIEFIRNWKEQKKIKIRVKVQRNFIRRIHWQLAKSYFKAAIDELILCFKWKGGAE